jgi:myo-inositol 2-dehydrogenase/D-chiro-inositol 1-dehydrogenase
MVMPFRLGLVGAGRMGRTHLRALSDCETVHIAAVAEPSEPARAAVDREGMAFHPNLTAMLQAGGIDGVLVAAPSTLHLELVARIAEAGLPILCEKPCGVTARHTLEAAAIAQRHGVRLQVAYWRRFVPALQRIRERILNGEFGALYFLACYQWDGEAPPPSFTADSGGILIDMGVHEFDQIRWLSGQEFARLEVATASVTVEPDSTQVLCSLSGGSTALVSLGRRFPLGDVCRVEVFGTCDAEECRFLWPPDGEAVFLDALRRQAEAFAASVRGGAAVGATAADAAAALAAAELAEKRT